MFNADLGNSFVRVRYRVCETVYLSSLRVGESLVELKVEVYELPSGLFSAAVFALEYFNLEYRLGPPKDTELSLKGVVPFYVIDEFYDTTAISARSQSEALQSAFQIIHEKLTQAGCDIEVF